LVVLKKYRCDICSNEVTRDKIYEMRDADVCKKCLPDVSFTEYFKMPFKKLEDFQDRLVGNASQFEYTRSVGNIFRINEDKREILLASGEVISFDDVVKFELIEDDHTVAGGGVGRAVVGGVIAGGAGAVVGALTGNKRGNCKSLQVKLTTKNTKSAANYITFISNKTKKKSKEYEESVNLAQETMSLLEIITSD